MGSKSVSLFLSQVLSILYVFQCYIGFCVITAAVIFNLTKIRKTLLESLYQNYVEIDKCNLKWADLEAVFLESVEVLFLENVLYFF